MGIVIPFKPACTKICCTGNDFPAKPGKEYTVQEMSHDDMIVELVQTVYALEAELVALRDEIDEVLA